LEWLHQTIAYSDVWPIDQSINIIKINKLFLLEVASSNNHVW
jgi:hypothetical protein